MLQAEGMLREGVRKAKAGEHAAALQTFRRCLRYEERTALAYVNIAATCNYLGQYHHAVSLLHHAISSAMSSAYYSCKVPLQGDTVYLI